MFGLQIPDLRSVEPVRHERSQASYENMENRASSDLNIRIRKKLLLIN